MTKLDLAQFERTCSDDMAQVDRVFLLAECKRQREQIAKLRAALQARANRYQTEEAVEEKGEDRAREDSSDLEDALLSNLPHGDDE